MSGANLGLVGLVLGAALRLEDLLGGQFDDYCRVHHCIQVTMIENLQRADAVRVHQAISIGRTQQLLPLGNGQCGHGGISQAPDLCGVPRMQWRTRQHDGCWQGLLPSIATPTASV